MSALRQRMIEDMTLRNLSPRTIKAYVAAVAAFAKFAGCSPDLLAEEDIRRFQLHLVDRKVSWSTYNTVTCALRFFYANTLKRELDLKSVPYARRPRKLPLVLSQSEILKVLDAAVTGRDRVALMVAYSAGLRVSEVCTLRVEDIDSERMLIHVVQGKGRKDRLVPLSSTLLEVLRAYFRLSRPKTWLFPGRQPDTHVSSRALQRVIVLARAAVGKPITMHTLRHSFATHLLETGTDIRTVQALLGHWRLSTTEIYNHVARRQITAIKSPLDLMEVAPG
jgi:integrase/recombinase XerD